MARTVTREEEQDVFALGEQDDAKYHGDETGPLADNVFGDSAIYAPYKMLTTRYTKGDNSGSYEAVNEWSMGVLRALDEQVDQTNFAVSMGTLSRRYAGLLGACQNYLDSHSGLRWSPTGRGRVSCIKAMRAAAERELAQLAFSGQRAAASGNPMTWRECLFGANRANARAGANGIARVGVDAEISNNIAETDEVMTAEAFKVSYDPKKMQMGGMNIPADVEYVYSENDVPDPTTAEKVYYLLQRYEQTPADKTELRRAALTSLLQELGTVYDRHPVLARVFEQTRVQLAKLPMDQSGGRSAVSKATLYGRVLTEGGTRRDAARDALNQANPGTVSEDFQRLDFYSRVTALMDSDDIEQNKVTLLQEMMAKAFKGIRPPKEDEQNQERPDFFTQDNYDAMKANMMDRLLSIANFKLFDLTEAELMDRYEELTHIETAGMHISDLSKDIFSPTTGKSLKEEVFGSDFQASWMGCLNVILSQYRILGRGLWTIAALDQGWQPTANELFHGDLKKLPPPDQTGRLDPAAVRAFAEKKLVNLGRQNLIALRNHTFATVIPILKNLPLRTGG